MIWRSSNPTDRIRVEKIPGMQIDKKKTLQNKPKFYSWYKTSTQRWFKSRRLGQLDIYISQRLAHKTFRTMSVDTLHSELQRGLQVVLIKCGKKVSQHSVHKQLHNTLFYLLINNSPSLSLIISTWKSGFLSMISGYVFIHKKQSGFKQIQVFLTFRIHIY